MHFTQEDYRKIENWLYHRTIKDTEFNSADPLDGTELVPIIQDNKNKTVGMNDFVKQVANMKLPDFYNVTANSKRAYITLAEAISLVPIKQRRLGLTITFHNENGNWLMYQFKGDSVNQWNSVNYWSSLIQEAIEEFILFPDEEDITAVRDGNRTFIKFKNREYNPEEFSGMGMIILRKNLIGTEACSIDDEDHLLNVLTQDMIREENTVYIVQYDFDLDGKVISIPKGCTLWFQGGSINNGTIYLQETAILGAFEFADMGNAKLFGKFNTGQVMTFYDDSYKAKTGGYFVAGTKPSSATVENDAKNERETFYDKNPNAYTTQNRQELRWWNGEEWILILDITDYNEIKSIINDLIEKHNAEMSACYQYFKTRTYALEVRMDEAETRIENHETRITKVEGDITSINQEINNIHSNISNIEQNVSNIENNITDILNQINSLGDVINDIDNIITEQIKNYLANNIIGANSITVNGTKYTPDENGNITLPDYPDDNGGISDKVAHKLKFTGASTAEYDGSEEVTVNIPEGGLDGGIADGVKGTLTIQTADGTSLGSYNGSEDKTITIPSGEGGGDTIITAKELLTVKQGTTTLGTYDGTTAKTITIPATAPSADKLNRKLKFTGAVTAEYDGSQAVTVNIPSGGSGGSSNETLTIKERDKDDKVYDGSKPVEIRIPALRDLSPKSLIIMNGAGEVAANYDTLNAQSIQVKKIRVKTNKSNTSSLPSDVTDTTNTGSLASYDIDLLQHSATIDLTKLNYGDSTHPIVLFSGTVSRASKSTSAWKSTTITKHPHINSVGVSMSGYALKIVLGHSGNNIKLVSAFTNAAASAKDTTGDAGDYTNTEGATTRSDIVDIRTRIDGGAIFVRALRTSNANNDAVCYDAMGALTGDSAHGLTRFDITVLGYIDYVN